MRPLQLRDEDPPADAVVVVRGGQMNSEFVRRSASQSHQEFGFYGLSVFAAIDTTIDELCRAEPMLARYGQIRTSTVGRLRALGFAFVATLERPHFDLVLPDLSDEALDRLERGFDPAIPNPARQKRE